MRVIPTSAAASDYIWFGQKCLKEADGERGVKVIVDGTNTVICQYTEDTAYIIVESGKFLAYPRSGGLRQISYWDKNLNQYLTTAVYGGGYAKKDSGWVELPNREAYPLRDFDQGTFVLDGATDETPSAYSTAAENYGNIWWTGADGTTLSWRGTPNRHFPVPNDIVIPGVSIEVGFDKYATFGNCVYSDGSILCKSPQYNIENEYAYLVAGACYFKDTLIIITVNTEYLQIFKSSDTGKTFNEIGTGVHIGDLKTPAFVSVDGSAFVLHNKLYRLAEDLKGFSEELRVPADVAGQRLISGSGGYGSTYTYMNAEKNLWPSINKSGELEYFTTTESASASGGTETNSDGKMVDVPIYIGNPATAVWIEKEENTNRYYAYSNGNYCKIRWDGVDSYNSGVAIRAPKKCNEGFTITVTLEPQGISGTYTQKKPDRKIEVMGPDEFLGNDYYSPSGGVGPFTWTFPDPESCGMQTISVEDACGTRGSKNVRMPNGQWSTPVPSGVVCNSGAYDFNSVTAAISGETRNIYCLHITGCGLITDGYNAGNGVDYKCVDGSRIDGLNIMLTCGYTVSGGPVCTACPIIINNYFGNGLTSTFSKTCIYGFLLETQKWIC